MSEHKEPIPSMIYNAAVGGHVTNSQQIIDENENKEQSQINVEVKQILGQGGSVDTRIANAVNTEKTRAEIAEKLLQEQYNALTQSDIVVGTLPESGTKNLIYRVPGTNSYSDYMWNGTQFVKMAEYDNAIDDEPTAGSHNLVKSGGVANKINDINIKIGSIFSSTFNSISINANNIFNYRFIKGREYLIKTNNTCSYGITLDTKENVVNSSPITFSEWSFIASGDAIKFQIYVGENPTTVIVEEKLKEGSSILDRLSALETGLSKAEVQSKNLTLGTYGFEIKRTVSAESITQTGFLFQAGKSYSIKNLSSTPIYAYNNDGTTRINIGLLNADVIIDYVCQVNGECEIYNAGTSLDVIIKYVNSLSNRISVLETDIDTMKDININVSSDGTKDYTNIVDAINYANSLTNGKKKNIILWDRYNDVYSSLGGDTWAAQRAQLPDEQRQNEGLRLEDNVNIIGKYKNTILLFNISDEYANEFASCLNPLGNNSFKNIHVIASNCRYACHDELFGRVDGFVREVDNCYFQMVSYSDIRGSSPHAYGCGSGTNCKYIFNNVIFETYSGANFFIHTNYNIVPISVLMNNCFTKGADNKLLFSSYGTTEYGNSIAMIGQTNATIQKRLETEESVDMWEIFHS